MSNMTVAYARRRVEGNQPDPDDYDSFEEYEAAFREYWEAFDKNEADYYEGLVDAARDDALLD